MYPEYTAQAAPPAIVTVMATRASTEARSAGPRSSASSHHGLSLKTVSPDTSASLPTANPGHSNVPDTLYKLPRWSRFKLRGNPKHFRGANRRSGRRLETETLTAVHSG